MAIITDGGTIITVPSARPVYTPGSDLKYWWPMQAAGIPMSSYGYLSANTYSLDVANGTPQYQYAQYGTEYVVRFDHEDTANNELVETGNSIFADSCQSASV